MRPTRDSGILIFARLGIFFASPICLVLWGKDLGNIIGNYWALAVCTIVPGLLMFMLLPPQRRYGMRSRPIRHSKTPPHTSSADDNGDDWRAELREKERSSPMYQHLITNAWHQQPNDD
jgi:hypothetical protein